MCCRSRIWKIEWDEAMRVDVLKILEFAGFERMDVSPHMYERKFDPQPGDDVKRRITVEVGSAIEFALDPSIGDHSYENHSKVGLLAAITFQLINLLAERTGGYVQQTSLRGACAAEQPGQTYRVLTDYHEESLVPFKHENLCLGFRQVMEAGIVQR